MKKYLPNNVTSKAKAAIAKHAKIIDFPSISRFIPERTIALPQNSFYPKLFVVSFISGLLLMGIILQTVSLINNVQKEKDLVQTTTEVNREISYWKGIVQKYPGYRDVYLKLATLEYRLGNATVAKYFIDKAFLVDPNTKDGKVLGEKIGIKR